MNERESIVAYIEQRADEHQRRAEKGGRDSSYHRGTATLFRALASDIKAGLDAA